MGMFIIDDDNPVQSALPREYGIDDFPLILHDYLVGPGTLVNGSLSPTLVTDQARIRFRLLNATDRQFFDLGFADDHLFDQIASDGGLLARPARLTRLTLGPGERAEIVVNRSESARLTRWSFSGSAVAAGAAEQRPC